MPEFLDHLVAMTALRDREDLDVTLAEALQGLVPSRSLAICRPVGDPGDLRWLARTKRDGAESAAGANSTSSEPSELPPVALYPERCRALAGQEVFCIEQDLHVSVFPMASDRNIVGVVELKTSEPLDQQVHQVISRVLRFYQNYQALLDYSECDMLTGLLNRKTFEQCFHKITSNPAPATRERISRPGSFWLAMIDVDFFKRVNDTYGHLIGDEVLLLLSQVMRRSFRGHDRLYRFGGEEFAVLCHCSASGDALRVFERLRRNVQENVFPQVGGITVSIGITEVQAGESACFALDRADQAVYFVKQNGRNQVRDFAELIDSGAIESEQKVGSVELF